MRKDSLIVFATTIVLTLGIVGGAHYHYLQGQKKSPGEVAIEPPPDIGAGKTHQPTSPPAVKRTATIIKCTESDGTVFYTNATRCIDADLNNRFSIVESVKAVPRVRPTGKSKSASTRSGSDPQRLKSIPRSMTNACSFPIGKAQKIEKKSLRLKDPPAESVWKDSYCRWVCEARVENCGDLEEYLRYTHICPEQWRPSKRSCGT